MIKSQRILIAIALPLLALILHITMCEWELLNKGRFGNDLLAFWGRGLFVQRSSTHVSAVVLGILVPLTLLAVDGYLILGWRFQRAVAQGRCPHCGYDLSGTDHTQCPECGNAIRKANPA